MSLLDKLKKRKATPKLEELPAGIDLSALWEEPTEENTLPMLLSGASAAISLITLIVLMFK